MYLQFEKQTELPLKTFFTIVLHFVSNFEVDGKTLFISSARNSTALT